MSKRNLSIAPVAALAAVLLAGVAAAPALAKDAPSAAIGVNGVAFVNLPAVVQNSVAFTTAQAQRPTTYKAQFDSAQARKTAIQAQLQPLVDKAQKDNSTPGFNPATLQQEVQTIQQIQDSGNKELQTIMQPVAYSEAYVQEQINAKLVDAVKAAMAKNGVTLLLRQEAVVTGGDSANLNPAVLAELNAILPSAQLVPPAGWEPAEVRDAKAQQAGQAAQRGTESATDGR